MKKVDRSNQIGQKRTQETKDNISKAAKGRIFSKEHRKNLINCRKGRPLTEEHKRKISDFWKKIRLEKLENN